jgi:hypothetical protein
MAAIQAKLEGTEEKARKEEEKAAAAEAAKGELLL